MKVIESLKKTKEGQEFLLKSASVEDGESLLEYYKKLLHESWDNLNYPSTYYDTSSTEEEVEIIRDFDKSPSSFLLLAKFETKIVGHLKLWVNPGVSSHCGTIVMGVLKEFHGRRIGRALLEHTIDETSRIGVWNLQLKVRAFNSHAISLYEKFGFQNIGTLKKAAKIKDIYSDEIIMQRISDGPHD